MRSSSGSRTAGSGFFRRALLSILALACWAPALAQPEAEPQAEPQAEPLRYRTPPAPIGRILEAPGPPLVLPSPDRRTVALLSRPGLPPIAELAEPELGLAGLSVNPRNNGPASARGYEGISFQSVDGGEARQAALPEGARLIAPLWSPDGRRLAFLMLREETVELWSADAGSGAARRIVSGVNAAFPRPFEWLSDGSGLLVRLVPEGRGAPPQPDRVPGGPIVRESAGRTSPVQTLRNLLASPQDEALFDHLFTSQLALAPLDGPTRPIGSPGIIAEASVSPDGRWILQHRLKRPYSYSHSANAFPTEILVTDLEGRVVRRIADRPLLDAGPAAVAQGPRAVQWRSDAPATLLWADAVGGQSAVQDRLFLFDAPFTAAPRRWLELDQQFQSILWGREDFALVISTSRAAASELRIAIDPRRPGAGRLLQVRAYRGGAEAGTPLSVAGPSGGEMLLFTPDGSGLLLETGSGLARLDIADGRLTELWREMPGEELIASLGPDAQRLLTERRSRSTPPNLFVVDRTSGAARQITHLGDPAPEFAGVTSRVLSYARSDGVRMRGTLHLPAGHDVAQDGRLPVLVWAYPVSRAETAEAAPSGPPPERFVRPQGFRDLPLLLLTRGYAVFEAGMPIVGVGGAEPNDSHVAQIVANAEAAVEALAASGAADPDRIAIGGWSFGAGMAASLLAHSDLFRTGIAISGAYNRTLTPFGFQQERRSFWEARDAYLAMSAFVHADRIDEPLLLMHGAADSNSGTWPMQSERLYEAIRGNGGTVRYVLFPHEGHAYQARESLMHAMWEITRWLDLHLRADPAG